MERNYQKEYTLALQRIAELQELVFAYQSMLDDAQQDLDEVGKGIEEGNQIIEGEDK